MITNNRTMSRRDFLAGGVGVAVGICSLGGLRQSTLRAAESSAKSKMRFGLTTYTWGKDWDIPTLITNCEKAGLYGVELRTSLNYAHGVELTLSASQRAAVKQRFADSPVHLVSIACSERLDWPERDKLRAAIEACGCFPTSSTATSRVKGPSSRSRGPWMSWAPLPPT
jgi:sugar phosphate isomerase/epimerase